MTLNQDSKKDFLVRLSYLGLLFLIVAFYFVLNRTLQPKFNFQISLDASIPLIPLFSIFYLSYVIFLFGWITYAFFNFERLKYQRLIITLIIIQLIAYAIYILFPAEVNRPWLAGQNFFEQLVAYIYQIDKPVNVLPSLHTANTFALALFLKNRYPKIVLPWALTIIASTVLIKQHYVLDVVSGLALSSLVFLYFRPKN